MSDPRRLLDEGSDLEIAVLDSAQDDAAPKGLHRRLHVALGLSGAIVGAGAATTATTSAAAATSSAKGVGILASIGVAKWVGVAAIGSVAAVGAAAYVESRHAETAPSRPLATAVAQPSNPNGGDPRVGTPPGQGATAGPAEPVLPQAIGSTAAVQPPQPAPSAAAPTEGTVSQPMAREGTGPTTSPRDGIAGAGAATATPSRSPSLAPGLAPDLATELAPLDAAHAALDSGDTALALKELDRHDRAFPRGRLAPETLALRIEAYAKRQDDAKVTALARTFLSRYPTHPQARRVQSIVLGIRAKDSP